MIEIKDLHVSVEDKEILHGVNLKIDKGADYAKNKLLVVFFDGAGEFYRNKIREAIFGRHGFEAVFCVGLLDSNENGYSYSVSEFRESFGDQSVTHKVEIHGDFSGWDIEQIMPSTPRVHTRKHRSSSRERSERAVRRCWSVVSER